MRVNPLRGGVRGLYTAAWRLDSIMPNGKRLAECTGAELVGFSGNLVKIGEAVGHDKLAGEVLTDAKIEALFS